MATFIYEARDATGQRRSGTLTAESHQAALRELEALSLFPIDLRPITESGGGGLRIGRRIASTRTLSMLYGQLADLLNAGVPILRALEVLARQNRRRPALAHVLDDVRQQVSGGLTLADALAHHPAVFPDLHVAMVRAGERGGFLEEVLARIAAFTERQDELRGKVIGSLAYPIFLMVIGTAIVLVLLVFFVPRFATFFDPRRMALPASTKMLLATSRFLQAHWGLMLAGAAAAVLIVWGLLSGEGGRRWWDRRKLTLPLIGPVFTLMAVARFCRILGTMLANGIPILTALRVAKDSMGNRTLADLVEQAADSVRAGEPLAVPLGKGGYFPGDLLDMIAVAEESNTLDTVLVNVAEGTERRLARTIDTAVRLIEPLLLLLMAAVVFLIAISLLLPIFSLSSSAT